jgi:hypothetical protein
MKPNAKLIPHSIRNPLTIPTRQIQRKPLTLYTRKLFAKLHQHAASSY